MELLAALGFGAKELFNYNRENFKFDQDQRLEREALRLEMQVKRYELFREDVRDLVDLTVDRMDVYHLVGSLFLEFCIVLFCEGRIQASAPPFVLSLFLLSNACSFIYLLLAVWLSMHASIASHSFGVRLLTRFVRLPIPSMKQLSQLRSQLRDYERQGVVNLLRLPFLNKSEQVWKQAEAAEEAQAPAGSSDSAAAAPEAQQPPPPFGRAAGPSAKQLPASAASHHPAPPAKGFQEESLLPEVAEAPIGGEDLLSGAAGAEPERHVQLFRQLQCKWQCYDAYCRVCMGLGVNQMLQSLSYYAVAHTLIENRSPTTGYALVFLFQSTTVALAVLDLAGMKRREIIAIQVLGMVPVIIAASELSRPTARDAEGNLVQDHRYKCSPLCFLFQVVWLELWRRVAMPDSAKSQLPRRFRQVLFLDVFGDASAWGAEASREKEEEEPAAGPGADTDFTNAATETAERAATQLLLAQWAVRRWVAAPDWALSQLQRSMLQQLCKRLSNAGRTIQAQLDCCRTAGVSCGSLVDGSAQGVFEEELRPWRGLSEDEKRADPFAECLLGPFEHDSGYQASSYHYNLENQCCHFEAVLQDARILTIDGVEAIVQDLEKEERELLSARMLADFEQVRGERHSFSSFERRTEPRKTLTAAQLEKAARAAKESFPNLSNMLGAGSEASEEESNDLKRALVLTPVQQGVGTGRGSRRETVIELNNRSTVTSADAPGAPPPAAAAEEAAARGQPRKSVASPFLAQDATLQAMAGEHAEHFVPERLPWQVVSSMTRVLQLAWLWSGAMVLLKVCNIYQADFQHHAGGERRLCASGGQLSFESLPMDWPRGALFHPQGIYRGAPTLAASGDGLIMSSPYAFYQASAGEGPLGWQELLRSRTPASTALLCAAPLQQPSGNSTSSTASAVAPGRQQRRQAAAGAGSCLLAAPSGAGHLAFWRFGDDPQGKQAQVLQVEGFPWRLLTGAVIDCEAVSHLASPEMALHAGDQCVLLVGWDGASLPIAVHPLEEDARGVLLPFAEGRVQHEVDAPLAKEDAERGVVALHLEPRSSRLWVLLASGSLMGWDLTTSRGLGSWELRWPEGSSFQPVSFCEDVEDGSVLVLGRSKALGPLLLRAAWPSTL